MIIIYTDDAFKYVEDNKEFLIEELQNKDADVTDDALYEEAYRCIEDDGEYLKDILTSYDRRSNNDGVCVEASLGLWYGRRAATARFNSLNDAFYRCIEDYNTVFFKRVNSTMTLKAAHHDGVNVFKFYALRGGKKYAITFNDMQ